VAPIIAHPNSTREEFERYSSSVVQAVSTNYIVVCRGPNCRERGGLGLRKRLSALLKGEERAALVGYNCFGQCDFGPNLLFYPEGVWYGGLTDDDADFAVNHATCGAPMRASPLELPSLERAEHLRNIADLVGTLERDRARGRPWWWPF
jgi:(2Fe-2S) ferredoxin